MNATETENKEQAFVHKDGVTYFSKRTERRIFFVLTVAMLLWGAFDFAKGLF